MVTCASAGVTMLVDALRHGQAAALAALLLVGRAEADPTADDRALATALFNEGRALLSEGATAKACPKLEESHRLDPSGGTILNLALCHEQQGFLARSWSEFHEAASFARRDGRSDREQAAEEHVQALEPRLSKLTIVVPESMRTADLRVERDGRELGQASWSTAMPVDGGEHIVRATAPGRVSFSATVVIENESDLQTVEIPPLALAPVAPTIPALAPTARAPAGAPSLSEGPRGGGVRRILAWTMGAAGLVQWGAAGYLGLRAFHKHADSNSGCPDGRCTAEGVERNDESRRAADASTVFTLTGLVTVAASAYLFLSSPQGSEAAPSAAAPTRVTLGNAGSTIILQGRF